ncbi:MAG: hypothetical protein FH748_10570 [Balneolaceae bacterium]|nr:hypothetical protein [Balneolaceae bacterium]
MKYEKKFCVCLLFIVLCSLFFSNCLDNENKELHHPIDSYMPDYKKAVSTDDEGYQIADVVIDSVLGFFQSSEKQFQLGGTTSHDLLGNVKDLTTDSSGNIYILDNRTYSIRKYDSGGNLLKIYGGVQGRGPNDLFRPIAVDVSSESVLYQSDYPHPFKAYDVSEDKLDFLQTYEPKNIITTDFCLMNDEVYVRSLAENPNVEDSLVYNLIHVFSQSDIEFITAFGDMYNSPRLKTNKRLSGGLNGKVACIENTNTIVYTFESFNYLYATDQKGELKWVANLSSLTPFQSIEKVHNGQTRGWRFRYKGDRITTINQVNSDYILVQAIRNKEGTEPVEVVSYLVSVKNGSNVELDVELPRIIHIDLEKKIYFVLHVDQDIRVEVWKNE